MLRSIDGSRWSFQTRFSLGLDEEKLEMERTDETLPDTVFSFASALCAYWIEKHVFLADIYSIYVVRYSQPVSLAHSVI
jgi:hypothetical protein